MQATFKFLGRRAHEPPQVALRLARLLAAKSGTHVTSIFRNPEHKDEIAATGAEPLVLSLEDAPKEEFAKVFEGKDIVYFSAGAGGKGLLRYGNEHSITFYPSRTHFVMYYYVWVCVLMICNNDACTELDMVPAVLYI